MSGELKWCHFCGEGVTTFCRGKKSPDYAYKCAMGWKEMGKPQSGSVNEERTLYEVTGNITDINTLLIDRARMDRALASESTSIPSGLSPDELARFISARAAGDDLQKSTHTDHPSRHWDRTCPACHEEAMKPGSRKGFNTIGDLIADLNDVEKNPDTRVGWMCQSDFIYEIGEASDGVEIFASVEDLKKLKPCWESCGYVRVEVRNLTSLLDLYPDQKDEPA